MIPWLHENKKLEKLIESINSGKLNFTTLPGSKSPYYLLELKMVQMICQILIMGR